MTSIADTAQRANVASGFGTATDGNVWTIQSGDGQSVASNDLQVNGSTASTFATLGPAFPYADVEGLVRFQVQDTTNTCGVLLRWTDTSNHWLMRYNGATGVMQAMVKVAGTYTILSPTPTFAPGASNFYWLRFRAQGTTISFKIWQDGTSEPSAWTAQYLGQTARNVPGKAGVYGFSNSGPNLYDHFSAVDITAPPYTIATLPGFTFPSLTVPAATAVNGSATLTGSGALGAGMVAGMGALGDALVGQGAVGNGGLAGAGSVIAQSIALASATFLGQGTLGDALVGMGAISTGTLAGAGAAGAGGLAGAGAVGAGLLAGVGNIIASSNSSVNGAATLKGSGALGAGLAAGGGAVGGGLAGGGAVGNGGLAGSGSLTAASAAFATATLLGQGALGAGLLAGVGNLSPQSIALGSTTLRGAGGLGAGAVAGAGAIGAGLLAGMGTIIPHVTQPGTGIGDLAVTTKSQSWSGGPAGSPGTETDVTYTDASNSGWTVGLIPTYGGMPTSPWYEVDNGVTGTNETSLTTSVPDGAIHWLDQNSVGVFAGSEDPTFTMTEQAPTGTAFRRYYKTVGNASDANGLNWTGWICIYPGDPGLMAVRLDMTNPSSSAIALAGADGLEIALIGGMEQADSTWAPGNGKWNTLGGTEAAWSATLVNGEPDYAYITPAAASGVAIARLVAKATSLSGLGWTSLQNEYLQNTSRLKFKVQGTVNSVSGLSTTTVYFLYCLRRNLTSADALAIAADYINPGTPTVTTGSFTSFSYDERAYVYAASSNQLSTTLDLTPAHVTVRYKPVVKLTGWTGGAPPLVTWGGTVIYAGLDYRYTVDSTNSILYLQLYFDVVASGATGTQKNNAVLAVQPGVVNGVASLLGMGAISQGLAGAGALVPSSTGFGAATLTGAGTLGAGMLSGTGGISSAQSVALGIATLQGAGALGTDALAGNGAIVPRSAALAAITLTGGGALGAGILAGVGIVIPTGSVSGANNVNGSAILTGGGALMAGMLAGGATVTLTGSYSIAAGTVRIRSGQATARVRSGQVNAKTRSGRVTARIGGH